jgi:hypothetical protein
MDRFRYKQEFFSENELFESREKMWSDIGGNHTLYIRIGWAECLFPQMMGEPRSGEILVGERGS